MSKAEQIYEEVNALVTSGVEQADAFRQVAEKRGLKFDSARGAYYTHKRKLEGGGNGSARRPRKRETTPADAVEQAAETLRRSIERIDGEIEAAKVRAEEAQAEYRAMKDSAKERKAQIEEKLSALES